MQNFIRTLTGIAAAAALGVVLVAGTAERASAQSPAAQPAAQAGQTAAQPEKKPKDTGEYDIINEVIKDLSGANPQKTLTDLNAWAQKYPETDYKDDRLFYFMQAYSSMQPPQPDKVLDYGAQLMAKDLKAALPDASQILRALYLITANTPFVKDPTPAQFAIGQKAAKDLQAFVPTYFTAEHKPATATDQQWAQARVQVEQAAAATLLYITMYPGAKPRRRRISRRPNRRSGRR